MSTQAASSLIEARPVAQGGSALRGGLFVLALACGLAVFVFGANYFEIFPTNHNIAYQAALAILFLAAAAWLKRDPRGRRYWPAAFAFATASFALATTSLIGRWNRPILGWFNVTLDSPQGMAVDKVYEMLMIVVPIIVLTRLAGADFGTLYLSRGDLKTGLGIGALVFFNFAASVMLFFATQYTSMDRLGAAMLWGVVFSFANGFMEELWLRGLFLKRLAPLLGAGGAVASTAIVFSLMHAGALYLTPVALPFMVANTLTLGLACGYLTVKTGSIWGAVLIHAAADFFLFIATLANV